MCQRPLQVYTVLQMGLQTEPAAIGEFFMHRAFLIPGRQKPNNASLWQAGTVVAVHLLVEASTLPDDLTDTHYTDVREIASLVVSLRLACSWSLNTTARR